MDMAGGMYQKSKNLYTLTVIGGMKMLGFTVR